MLHLVDHPSGERDQRQDSVQPAPGQHSGTTVGGGLTLTFTMLAHKAVISSPIPQSAASPQAISRGCCLILLAGPFGGWLHGSAQCPFGAAAVLMHRRAPVAMVSLPYRLEPSKSKSTPSRFTCSS
eukprot:1142210-Pelagomonas_calceolata.AAC.3